MPSNSKERSEEGVITIDLNKLLTPFAIIIAGLMISGTLYFSDKADTSSSGNDNSAPSVQGAADVPAAAPAEEFTLATTSIDDDAVKGDKSIAKVAIVEFSDFECPYCQRHFSQTYSQIVSEYVDTGDAIYVFRDFPLDFHPQAKPAALAANCVGDLGGDSKYFEYHDLLFGNNVATANRDSYIAWAGDVGVDTNAFTTCFDENRFADEVDADMADGQTSGVSGTPGFIIGTLAQDGTVSGKLIAGAYPFASF